MDGVYLFGLAARHSAWLAVRQAAVAQNVSNADTPGYRAREVEPFDRVLDAFDVRLAATSPAHVVAQPVAFRPGRAEKVDGWDVSVSDNSVTLEQEMIKAGEVERASSLNVSVVKAFHRMVMAGLR